MRARFLRLIYAAGEAFWLLPAAMVAGGIVLAFGLVAIDRRAPFADVRLYQVWLYDGGATGARTLLGAVAASMIGVAGTAFSITIAALSLAAGQMGPRLLSNFTRDRGNQATLGAFLGTFSYALIVLRFVRTPDEGGFVPHLALSVAIVLALLCVGMLVFFVGHMAGRINVETVIQLVSDDVMTAMRSSTTGETQGLPPPLDPSDAFALVCDERRGYLQQLDDESLADWAAENATTVRLLLRPGSYVFPGAPIALVSPPVAGADEAVRKATALGVARTASGDLEFPVRQLVELAVRALSPGINDPHTAISVLDQLGAALCHLAPLTLLTGVVERNGQMVLVYPHVNYDGLSDAMFHMIRQNAASSPSVLIRMLEILTAALSCETAPSRVATLARHADLVLADAERSVSNVTDLADVRARHAAFLRLRRLGPLASAVETATGAAATAAGS